VRWPSFRSPEHDEIEVLEALRPHASIKSVYLLGYPGRKRLCHFPSCLRHSKLPIGSVCVIFSLLRLSPTRTQNTRPIHLLGSATSRGFNTYSASSPTTGPKRESFLQMGFQKRGCHIWVVPLRQSKIGLPYRYSVGGWFRVSCHSFWVLVPIWVPCWRQSNRAKYWTLPKLVRPGTISITNYCPAVRKNNIYSILKCKGSKFVLNQTSLPKILKYNVMKILFHNLSNGADLMCKFSSSFL
jgi:hypothetical protein